LGPVGDRTQIILDAAAQQNTKALGPNLILLNLASKSKADRLAP